MACQRMKAEIALKGEKLENCLIKLYLTEKMKLSYRESFRINVYLTIIYTTSSSLKQKRVTLNNSTADLVS